MQARLAKERWDSRLRKGEELGEELRREGGEGGAARVHYLVGVRWREASSNKVCVNLDPSFTY